MRLPTALAAASAVVVLAGCDSLSEDVAATVNGVEIPLSTLESLAAAESADSEVGRPEPDDADKAASVQRRILTQLIEHELKAQAARDIGVVVPDEAVDEEWRAIAARVGGEEALLGELERRGYTEVDARRQIAGDVLEQMLSEHFIATAEIDPAEIERLYEERREERYRVAHVFHILVETESEAREILAELGAGADFAALAAARSIDEGSARRSGDLGESPRGQFVEPFEAAVWDAEEDEIVGPVETRFGWHVIHVRRFRDRPLVEVQDRLRDELAIPVAREAYDQWLVDALAGADIRVLPRLGEWDADSGAVVGRLPAPSG